jgi:chromate reductase
MNRSVKILGIAGSLRRESYNRSLLRAATELVPEGCELETFDIKDLPFYNQDHDANPDPHVAAFKDRIRAADAILFVTPEYNYSVPGVLKNAIDCASRPYGDSAWQGKPAAIMGASVGSLGTARAQYHLRQSMVFLNMHPLNMPEVMVATATERFDADGKLIHAKSRELVARQLQALVNWTLRLNAAQT